MVFPTIPDFKQYSKLTCYPVSELTVRKLTKALGCKSKFVKNDISKAITHGQAANSNFQERAQIFMTNSRLKTWLTSPESSVLLVNGNGVREKLSPLTLACGMLARSLQSFDGGISLFYFCGMHSEAGDDEEVVQTMLAHLVDQLLNSFPTFDLEFVKITQRLKDIKTHDLNALCYVFDGLVRQLSDDQIVFCLIDGITFYEYGKRSKSTRQVISMIVSLADECNAVFKLLITSSTKSISIDSLIPKQDILNLKPGSTRLSDQGLNIRRALEKNARSMESLSIERQTKNHPEHEWSAFSEGEEQGDTSSSESSTEYEGGSSRGISDF
jgi:hypothetical protein